MYYIIIGFLGWNVFYFIFTSSWFDIAEISISGNHYLDNETIQAQGGMKFHTNLFRFDIQEANNRLLRNPWIEDVSVKKIFPNQLSIHIAERKPGVILFHESRYYLVDMQGRILSVLQQMDLELDLYLVTGLGISSQMPGEVIENQEFQAIGRIIYALENIFPEQFYKIQVVSNEEFLLFHKEKQMKVRIENGDQLINEWYLLEKALQEVIEEDMLIQEINMKYKGRLSIILKEE